MDTYVAAAVGRLRISVTGYGPVTVFWHSLFADSTSWAEVVRRIPDRTVVLVDGPGHGESAAVPAHGSVSACGDAAAEIISLVSPGSPVDWVGNAWGGHVGLALAVAHPRSVRSLAVVSTPFDRVRGSTRARLHLAVTLLSVRHSSISRLARPIARGLLAPSADPALVESTAQHIAGMRAVDVARCIRQFSLARADERATLCTLERPIVFVVPEFGEAARSAPADARWTVLLRGTSTLAPQEDPDAVSTALRSFWSAYSS